MIASPRRRTVLLLADLSVDDDRQLRLCLRYADDHDLEIVAYAGHTPAAALAAVGAGCAIVLAAVEPPGNEWAELTAGVHSLGGRLVCIRQRLQVHAAVVDAEAAMIRSALHKTGGDVALVAELLGVSEQRVRAVPATAGQRRPTSVADPGNIRPRRQHAAPSDVRSHPDGVA